MTTPDFMIARANMVDGQLRPNRIKTPALLAAFAAVPRELFVPPAARGSAYADAAQPLGQGRQMHAPLVLAHLVQALEVEADDTVLVAAAAMGYSAAILAHMARQVVMVEDNKKFLTAAKNTLLDVGIANIRVLHGTPEGGAARYAPYDAILLNAPMVEIPPQLLAQLKDGGRLATLRQGADGLPEAVVFTKHNGTLVEKTLFETTARSLPGLQQAETFVF